MSRIRKVPAQYAQVAWSVAQDPSLDFVAVGIYAYIQSLPDDWDISVERLAKVKRQGIMAVRRAVDQLVTAGLYHRVLAKEHGQPPRVYVVVTPIPMHLQQAADSAGLTALNDDGKPLISEGTDTRGSVDAGVGKPIPLIEETGFRTDEPQEENKDQTSEPQKPRPPRTADDVDRDPAFIAFWAAFPQRKDKGLARRTWLTVVVRGKVDPNTVIAAAKRYRAEVIRDQTDPRFVKHASTWLNACPWEDDIAEDTAPRGPFGDVSDIPPPGMTDDQYAQWLFEAQQRRREGSTR